MIDRNHPAVEALTRAGVVSDEAEIAASEAYAQGATERPFSQRMRAALYAALPLLESATEDNLARLRDTPAGKQLLAEGWDRGVADNERGWDHVYSGHDVDPDDPLAVCQTCETPNPYRTEAPSDAPEG